MQLYLDLQVAQWRKSVPSLIINRGNLFPSKTKTQLTSEALRLPYGDYALAQKTWLQKGSENYVQDNVRVVIFIGYASSISDRSMSLITALYFRPMFKVLCLLCIILAAVWTSQTKTTITTTTIIVIIIILRPFTFIYEKKSFIFKNKNASVKKTITNK